jgi:DNA replication protein DnaC
LASPLRPTGGNWKKSPAKRKYLKEHLENAQVLVIDEISMLHAKQLNLVNQVLKRIFKVFLEIFTLFHAF